MNGEQFFRIEQLAKSVRQKNNLYVTKLFPKGALIRQGDLQIAVVGHDNEQNLFTMKFLGVYLMPKDGEEGEAITPEPAPVILTPDRRIVKP